GGVRGVDVLAAGQGAGASVEARVAGVDGLDLVVADGKTAGRDLRLATGQGDRRSEVRAVDLELNGAAGGARAGRVGGHGRGERHRLAEHRGVHVGADVGGGVRGVDVLAAGQGAGASVEARVAGVDGLDLVVADGKTAGRDLRLATGQGDRRSEVRAVDL